MRPVWVGQVGSYVYLVRFYLLQQFLNDVHVTLCHRQFLYLSALVERQVEEVDMVFFDTVVSAGIACLASSYQSFHGQHITIIEVALLLPFDKSQHFVGIVLDDVIAAIGKFLIKGA